MSVVGGRSNVLATASLDATVLRQKGFKVDKREKENELIRLINVSQYLRSRAKLTKSEQAEGRKLMFSFLFLIKKNFS